MAYEELSMDRLLVANARDAIDRLERFVDADEEGRELAADRRTVAAKSGTMAIAYDLETLGLNPGAIVRSIGAVAFQPDTGHIYAEFHVRLDEAEQESFFGLVSEPSTVDWWTQPEQAEALAKLMDCGCYSFEQGLDMFEQFIKGVTEAHDALCLEGPVEMWSRGYMDDTVLAAAYRAAGRKEPWHYQAPRDARTLVRTLGTFGVETNIPMEGVQHFALDDAKYEARLISDLWQRLAGIVNG